MATGKVIAIYIAQSRGDSTISMDQIHAVPGLGLEGDRFFNFAQQPKGDTKPGREITLVEMETIESLARDHGITLTPGQTRRNIVTHGIALNNLVDHNFMIGEVKLYGIRLCEPCQYLASRTDPRIIPAMIHKGGLRAEILTEGFININDTITSFE